ncbi:MAG: M23 family metallopeptidase [Acidimicrobiia bacterium]|nr:M23 family metallopeptidase [Acidimicrobiia bacterium]
MGVQRRAIIVVVLALAVPSSVLGGALPAFAEPLFQMPVPCGETWRGATYADHGGAGNDNPVDLNHDNGDVWEKGRPVLAAAGGTVTIASGDGQWNGGYGNYVAIDHGGGWTTLYAHLDSVSITAGQQVTMGQVLGGVGDTGATGGGDHIHFEERLNGTPQHVEFDGVPIVETYEYNGNPYTSRNCPTSPTPPRVEGDYDGDGDTDISVYTPSTGVWNIQNVALLTPVWVG